MSPPVSGAAISGRSRSLIITQQPPTHPPGDDHEGSPSALSRPGFRYGRRIVARLNSMHTTAGLSTVALLLVAAPHHYDRVPGGPVALVVCGSPLSTLIALFALLTVSAVRGRGRSERRIDHQRNRAVTRAAPTISTVLVALCVLYAMWSRPGRRSTGLLPTAEIMYSGIPLAQGVIVVALAIAGTVMFRSASTPRILLRGLAPATAVTLAFARYNMMTAGAEQGLADRLGNYGEPGTESGPLAGPRP
ncbi:hypothetical protein [Streptomyces anulatus]|uniref:hypothetical protein n=1 Tax=Streptomyces anulatus TaxID=1892 RepID=UPI00371DD2AA